MRLIIRVVIPALVVALVITLAATWSPNGTGSTMTPMDRVDLATFVVIVAGCAWDLWWSRRDATDEVRRTGLQSAGIILWASVLPAGVYLKRSFSLSAWFLLIAVLAAGGGLLFWQPWRD
jgi:hypothetical protein